MLHGWTRKDECRNKCFISTTPQKQNHIKIKQSSLHANSPSDTDRQRTPVSDKRPYIPSPCTYLIVWAVLFVFSEPLNHPCRPLSSKLNHSAPRESLNLPPVPLPSSPTATLPSPYCREVQISGLGAALIVPDKPE